MDSLSAVFGALADPTRRAILARLVEGSACAGELATPFAISQPAVSRHLKVLRQAGLIEQSVKGQWRQCTLKPEPLAQISDWLDHYRKFWEQHLDQLDDYLHHIQGNKKG